MTKRVEQLPLAIERLERALVLLAYFIELDGDVHLPMYEKFEAELTELKAKEAAKHRARKCDVRYNNRAALAATHVRIIVFPACSNRNYGGSQCNTRTNTAWRRVKRSLPWGAAFIAIRGAVW